MKLTALIKLIVGLENKMRVTNLHLVKIPKTFNRGLIGCRFKLIPAHVDTTRLNKHFGLMSLSMYPNFSLDAIHEMRAVSI